MLFHALSQGLVFSQNREVAIPLDFSILLALTQLKVLLFELGDFCTGFGDLLTDFCIATVS